MKSLWAIFAFLTAFISLNGFGSTYECNVFKTVWKGPSLLKDKDSREDKMCGHVILVTSDTSKNSAFFEDCDSLVVSIYDEGSIMSDLGDSSQLAQVRLLKSGKSSKWMSRDFLKQSSMEGAPLPNVFRLSLDQDDSNIAQNKNYGYGMVCQALAKK